jgi:hypothetical protein
MQSIAIRDGLPHHRMKIGRVLQLPPTEVISVSLNRTIPSSVGPLLGPVRSRSPVLLHLDFAYGNFAYRQLCYSADFKTASADGLEHQLATGQRSDELWKRPYTR